MGARSRDHPGPDLGADVPGRERHLGAVRRAGERARRADPHHAPRGGGIEGRARGTLATPDRRGPLPRDRGGRRALARSRRDARRVPALGRPAPDVARSDRVKRALLVVVAALATAAPAAAILPVHQNGSSVGEGVALKAYATMTPTVHLFGDVITARLAVIADTKWVNAQQLRVRTNFSPYVTVRRPQVLRLRSGRFLQVTYTWQLRCLASPCVPRLPPSDKFHVFHFSPAHIDDVTPTGRRAYGIDAYWPPVEVLSQVSPGAARFLQLTNHINWRLRLAPVASPTYRVAPSIVLWLAIALAAGFGVLALWLAGRWYLVVRPRRSTAIELPGTPLERALAVLRYAHGTGDETLQRKAFERVADELGVERADELTQAARELACSPGTPEDEEVEEFAVQALGAQDEEEDEA